MSLGSKRTILGATALTMVWLAGVLVAGQAGSDQKPPMADQVFKNVRVLKGIPVDEFMGTMGIFSAALGMSCEDCHSASDEKWENYALDVSPYRGSQSGRRVLDVWVAGGESQALAFECLMVGFSHRRTGSGRPSATRG